MGQNTSSRWSAGLRQRLDLLLGSVQTRLELLALELQEETLRIARILLATLLAALFLGAGTVFALIWISVALWDSHRLLALGVSTVLLLALALAAATVAARAVGAGSGMFKASLAELRADRAALSGRDRADAD
jgi:uncharacterized membrane protein YqjE